MKTELQAAATSKEEALMKLKARALQLEEELFQVRRRPSLRPACTCARRMGSCPSRGPSGLAPRFLASCSPVTPLGGLLEGALC